MAKVFVSYSRKDITFAKRLTAELQKCELDFWIDWEGIPPTVDWWREIEKGIEEADVFVFLISPDSAKSKVCGQEIEVAVKNGKRIIPIVVRDIDWQDTPKHLGHLNYIFIRESDDFDAAVKKLITAIQTDYEWAATHRRLQMKALEWERENKENSYLLRGRDLLDAEQDLATNTSKDPHPTDLQREYVFESRKATDKQRKVTAGLSISAVIALAALAIFGFYQADAAKEQARVSRAGELAALAIAEKDKHFDLALLFGVEGVRTLNNSRTQSALLSLTDSHPGLKTYLSGHDVVVRSIAYSPDGNYLASGSSDGSIILWDMSNPLAPSQVSTFFAALDPIYIVFNPNVVFSPDGKLLVWGDKNGTISLSEVTSPDKIMQLEHQNRKYSYLSPKPIFSQDGRYLALFDTLGGANIILWDIADLERPVQKTLSISALSLSFSPDGTLLATGNADGSIALWDTSNMAFTRPLAKNSGQHSREVNSIEFNRDGNRLVSSSVDGVIILWDITDPRTPIPRTTLTETERNHLSNIALSPDGNYLAWGAMSDFSTVVWDIRDPERPSPRKLFGHNNFIMAVAFSPDGKHLLSGGSDGSMILWNFHDNFTPAKLGEINATTFALSPAERLIAAGVNDSTIILANTEEPAHTSLLGTPALNFVELLVFSPDGRHLAASYYDGSALLWNISNASNATLGNPSADSISRFAFSSDGRYLASGNSAGTIILWDISNSTSPSPVGEISDHEAAVVSLAFLPDQTQLASGSMDGMIILSEVRDPAAPREIARLSAPDSTSEMMIFTPDGKGIGIGRVDGTISLQSINKPAELFQFTTPFVNTFQDLVFSRDANLLAAGTIHGTVAIWDIRNPSSLPPPATVAGGAIVAFSPDGKRLASGITDGKLFLWEIIDPASPIEVGSFSAKPSISVSTLVFSPDGKILVAYDGLGTITLWDADPELWAAKACERAGRNFTRSEWAQYFPDEDYPTEQKDATCPQWPLDIKITPTPTP